MKKKITNLLLSKRASAVLLPVFSLPGPYGIGDMGPHAQRFIDFLQKSGQSGWQILPMGPTSQAFSNSPYMSPSALGGNPLSISPDILYEQGLLDQSDLFPQNFSPYTIDYKKVIPYKQHLITKSWQRYQANGNNSGVETFLKHNPWVKDHSLFLALKKKFNQMPWYLWPKDLRTREKVALKNAETEVHRDYAYHCFEQYLFFSQWKKLHAYADSKGVQIIGDLPIYVALDSVDVWCNQEIFQLSKEGSPTAVAGVPPDYFSETGQLWGNPLYCWNTRNNEKKAQLLNWWEKRLSSNLTMTDVIRIDHFRGFESYWSVPAHENTAINGTWEKGPGTPFFTEMEKRLGPMQIIAEDLGMITPDVEKLRDTLGYPGMKVLLFAFGSDSSNTYLPHNISKKSVIYTGTHDNDTAVGWYQSGKVPPEEKQRANRYANQPHRDAGYFHRDLIHLALSSTANLSIFPMQDILGFGNDCRVNTPGTIDNNWLWRCAEHFLTDEVAAWLHDETAFYGRIPQLLRSKETKTT